jgi:hypothetical protein
VVETYTGLYLGMVGRYGEALQRLDAALACFARDRQAVWIAVASNHKAQFLLELGQIARARQALEYERPPIDHVRARSATVAARIERALGHSGRTAVANAFAQLRPGRRSARAHARPARAGRGRRSALRPCVVATRCSSWRRRSSSPASR